MIGNAGKDGRVKKGDIYEAVIEQYDFPNKGSLMLEDRKVMIKGALPGQRVRFMITRKKSGMAEGRVLAVLERAPIEDAEVSCSHFGVCGGCAYRTMSYGNQLTLKEQLVKKLLDRVLLCSGSGSEQYVWEGIFGSPEAEGYRNKMEFTFGDSCKGGPLSLGLHKKGSFHDILNVSGCGIIGRDWSRILDYTLAYFDEHKVPFYHRMSHEGILRNLVVRQSRATGEFMINLVTTTQWEKYGFSTGATAAITAGGQDCQKPSMQNADQSELPILEAYVSGLLTLAREQDFSGSIAGILYTENDTLGDVVQSDRMVCLYGRDYIIEEVMGLRFRISPFSFFQTNTGGCEVLYKKAREYILAGSVLAQTAACGEDRCRKRGGIVFDLYSGTGTIAQMIAPVAEKVIGIELVEEAVEAARENAQLNGLDNCAFIAGDVLKVIDTVEEKPDVIIVDPPRDGIHPKALEKILDYGVQEIVYISCKPTSLVRDLEVITQRGYRVLKACCVDQFPWTGHVETVVLLYHQEVDNYVHVDFEPENADYLKRFKGSATYAEIKAWVLEHYGFQVSSLYVAQIKRKCGLEVGENYNKAKSDDGRVPVCPKEKEDAIMEAFRYFRMI